MLVKSQDKLATQHGFKGFNKDEITITNLAAVVTCPGVGCLITIISQ